MTELRTADRGDIRDVNILAVINVLRRPGSATRAAIARETGLSAPTVSAVVSVLNRARLVDVTGSGPVTGGRRGELIALRPEAKLVLAIDLSSQPRRCALVDLARRIVPGSLEVIAEAALETPDRLAQWIAERLRALPQVLGVGVAAPGVTNSIEGIIEWAPSLGWRNARVRAQIEAVTTRLTVAVDNDLNLAALAEHAMGEPGRANLAMLGLRGGLGAGIILGGRLHRGVNFAAGELGYLPAPAGQLGTLDFGALEATLFSMLPGRGESTAPIVKPSFAVAGPVLNASDVTRVVDILAYGCFAVAVVLDVSAIILGEELFILVPNLDRILEQRVAAALPHPPRIAASCLGSFGTLQGAAVAVQQDIEFEVRRLLS